MNRKDDQQLQLLFLLLPHSSQTRPWRCPDSLCPRSFFPYTVHYYLFQEEAISFLSFTNCVLGKWIGSAAAAAAAARSTCLSFPRLETDWTAQQQQLGTDRVSYRTTNGCPATDGIDGHHSSSSLDLRHKQNNKKKKKKKKKSVDWLHVTCPDHLVTSSNRKKKGRKKDREVILSSNEASTFIHEQERRKKMLYYVWTEMNEWMQSRQPLKRSRPTNKERDI